MGKQEKLEDRIARLRKTKQKVLDSIDDKVKERLELKKKLEKKDKKLDTAKTQERVEKLEKDIRNLMSEASELHAEIAEDRSKVNKSLPNRIKRVRKALRKLIKRKKNRKSINTSSGYPHYGGSRDVLEKVLRDEVVKQYPIKSRKRSATHHLSISNPGSDHNEANITADAADFGTFSGANLAYRIAEILGIGNFSPGNYNNYYITVDGHTFRVQILWAVSGHYDHVHLGIRAI